MFYQDNNNAETIVGRNTLRTTLAVLDKKSQNAEQAVMVTLNSLERTESECLKMVAPSSLKTREPIRPQSEKAVSSVALGSISLNNEPTIVEIENGALAFHGRIYSPTFQTSPIAVVAERVGREREQAIEKIIGDSEGDFTSIVAEPERIVAGRDPMGVQPLYYGENSVYAAIGSNRKILWKLGLEETRSFPPGHLGIVTREGFKFKRVKTLTFSEPKLSTMKTAADNLLRTLELAVRVRVQDETKIAVAFSGGLDSSIVAFLAKKYCTDVQLVHVSLRGKIETEEAKKAADALNLPVSVHLFRDEDVASVVAKVVELVEDPDPIKTAIGIPIYWVAQKTAEAGFKVLLAGQGADELFGGYHRYSDRYCFHDEEEMRRTMFVDVVRIHESNLERDQKICNFHNVELRLPFASYRMAEFATNLPSGLKINREVDSARKLVLRKAAEKIGLPTWIARKPKKAVQYATGVNSALKKLARKRKTTVRELVRQLFVDLK